MKYMEYHTEISEKSRKNTPEGALFLDIESTGLKKENSILSIIACASYEQGLLHVRQWINDDAISEENMLKGFLQLLSDRQGTLITFNGDQFDLPFLMAHMEYNELNADVLEEASTMDLYRFLRGFAPILGLESSKQRTWENYLGIHRIDDISGRKCVESYKKYLKSKDMEDLHPLILHNLEDMKGLAHLMELLPFEQFARHDFHLAGLMEDSYKGQNALTFLVEINEDLPAAISLENSMGRIHMRDQRTALVTFPYEEKIMYHYYENYKDYYYLPLEDRAIHKSIGAFVDKEHRQKATARNCYIREESIFLPHPAKDSGYGFYVDYEECGLPFYKESYDTSMRYLNFDDLFAKNEITDLSKSYVANMMQAIFLMEAREKA